MSTIMKICFDASLHQGCVGIGIFNFDTKEEEIHRYEHRTDSTEAERIALIQTIFYLRKSGITAAHLFTDNEGLAKNGIAKTILKGFSHLTLTWIPREFNEDADRLSKKAHTLTPKILKPLPKPRLIKILTTPNEYKVTISDRAIFDTVKGASLGQKLVLLERWIKTPYSMSLFNEISSGSRTITIDKRYRKTDRLFIRMARTLLKVKVLSNKLSFDHLNVPAFSDHMKNLYAEFIQ